MRKSRGLKTATKPHRLETPIGCFTGEDILEGFAADAEYLGRVREESSKYDNEFYKLCKLDNAYIFEFSGSEELKIPPISTERFDELVRSLKRGKASDIYHLTAEHIKECGSIAKSCILKLLNSIINNIYFLTCPQIKSGLGSSVHKGKGNPLTNQHHIVGSRCLHSWAVFLIDTLNQ